MRDDQPDEADAPGDGHDAADPDRDAEHQPQPDTREIDAERARRILAERERIERAPVP